MTEILGVDRVEADGADGDMFAVRLDHGSTLLFVTEPAVTSQHLAVRVTGDACAAVVARLRSLGVLFGNDPAAADSGLTSDPLGGPGRLYFHDLDGHLLEVVAA